MTPAPLRLVFLGSDAIALRLLDWLSGEGANMAGVVAVFTQPDRPSGRGQRLSANPIKAWARERDLPVFQPEKLGGEALRALAELRADVSLVMAYGQILGDAFLAAPRLGSLNLHASLLPRYRGASPIQGAVAAGERETGVALMRVVRELDAGPVADVERVAIGPLDTAAEVEQKLSAACVPLMGRTLPLLARDRLAFVEQNHLQATYCRRLDKGDGVLDFAAPAAVLAARVNGLFPWPCCAVEISGQPVRLGLADAPGAAGERGAGAAPEHLPGTVTGTDSEGLLVSTGGGTLRLRRLQRPGGRMLPAHEFLNGFPVPPGTLLPSRAMPPLLR